MNSLLEERNSRKLRELSTKVLFLEKEVERLNSEGIIKHVYNTIENKGLKIFGASIFFLSLVILVLGEIYFKIHWGWWIATGLIGISSIVGYLSEI